MRTKRELRKLYKFSVEGETEKWYLEHLEKLLNKYCTDEGLCVVFSFEIIVSGQFGRCVKYAKNMQRAIQTLPVFAVFDTEDKSHQEELKNAIEEACQFPKINCAYSNVSFELWIILHKVYCDTPIISADGYLSVINSSYNKSFKTLDLYKTEKNFKALLKNISLDDVVFAYKNSLKLKKWNEEGQRQCVRYSSIVCYNSPDTDMLIIIKDIYLKMGKSRLLEVKETVN